MSTHDTSRQRPGDGPDQTASTRPDATAAARRTYSPPSVTTRPLFERLALSCEHAVDPDTGELIIDGPS